MKKTIDDQIINSAETYLEVGSIQLQVCEFTENSLEQLSNFLAKEYGKTLVYKGLVGDFRTIDAVLRSITEALSKCNGIAEVRVYDRG